jgi:putative transposase
MGKDNVVAFRGREASADLLTELLRAGARQLIEQAVEADVSLHPHRATVFSP